MAHPVVMNLEDRALLSASRGQFVPAAVVAREGFAEVIRFRSRLADRSLEIQGTSGADSVEIGRSARGLVTLTFNGTTYSADPRDRGFYDRRLAGVRADRLRAVRLVGSDPLDTVVLKTTLGDARSAAVVQSQSVTIATAVNQAGTLRIEAQSITVSAPVRADSIILSARGLLNLEAAGSLTAAKSVTLSADRAIQTGTIQAPAVTITANVLIRSSAITAPGGAVAVAFTENYVATRDAAIDVSSAGTSGGSVRIDGGTSGHFFSSGTVLARGGQTGGEIRVSGKDVVWVGGGADASGEQAGGLVHIGGGWQGSDASMTRAGTLQVSPYTTFSADGADTGGTVVLWSDESTTSLGTVSARGGRVGGAVEVSSKVTLAHGGAVDVGPGGRFLLDPKNIVIYDNPAGGVPMFELVNPTPNVNDSFGVSIVPLSTGNVVVTDPGDDAVGTDAGAVYLYNGVTGVLISTLTGSTTSDQVGNGGVTALSNGNYVVSSPAWDNGAIVNAGAVTWGSGSDGSTLTGQVGEAVSTANSIVGIGSNGPIQDSDNGTYIIRRSTSGGAVFVVLTTPLPGGVTFASYAGATSNMSPAFVAASLSAGTATTLQASNDIALANALTVNNAGGVGGTLTLQAGRLITFNANLTTDDGNLTVLANASASDGVVDAQRDAGAGGVSVASSVTLNAGSGAVSLSAGAATGLTNRASGGVTVAGTVTGESVAITTADAGSGSPDVSITGSVAATGAGGVTINAFGAVTIGTSGTLSSSSSEAAIAVTGASISLRGFVTSTNGNVTMSGPVTLAGNLTASTGSGVLAFADGLTIGTHAATITSTAAAAVAGTLSVNGGVILATGGGVSVGSAGSLTGNGTIIGGTTVAGGLAPGSGASGTGNGTLYVNAGSLTLAATSTVSLNGSSKTAFDKVIAAGVNLDGATLSLDLSAATLNSGDSITLMDNTASTPVSGSFAKLARGTIFTANGNTMQISYTGGDGNDIVVTRISDITANFTIARSGFLYVIASDTYRQTLTLTNLMAAAQKPRTFKFVGLPGDISVVGGTKSGSDWYLNLGDSSVPSGGTLGIPVHFVVPSGNAFNYTLEVLGG